MRQTPMALSGFLIAFSPTFMLSLAVAQGTVLPPHPIQGLDLASERPTVFHLNTVRRAAVIAFLSARCPCSASHENTLKELANEYSKQGFSFIGIHSNADEPMTVAQSHFTQAALPFPVVRDDAAKIADRFGAVKTPHVFVVAPNGEILYQGGVDDSNDAKSAKKPYLREALAALARGEIPPVALTRALGCVIKR